MNARALFLTALAVTSGLVLVFVSLRSSSAADTRSAAVVQDQDGMDEMMKKMMEAAAPGEHHKKMAELVGTWDMDSEMFMGPTSTKSKGVCEITMILGGRFMQMHEKSEMNGMPVEGMIISGYDNTTKDFVSVNMSTMGTGIYSTTGSEKDGVTTHTGMMCDFLSPKRPGRPYRVTIAHESADKFLVEVFDTIPESMATAEMKAGTEFKVMAVHYTRRAK